MDIREEAFKYYFYFIEERMNIFWKRYENKANPYTSDSILSKNKFTNVYRVTDRVSQYLIRDVIYNPSNKNSNAEDILLQILIFKIFNRIETWQLIKNEFGPLTIRTFNPAKISTFLSNVILERPIYSGAYMMTGVHKDYSHYKSKHEKWLNMVNKEFIINKKFAKIIQAKSLKEVFEILRGCDFLGEFLAYQYSIDFNYSEVINFDENSFVRAGIGAKRGISKCFRDLNNHSYEDAIYYTLENFEKLQNKFGFANFKNLFGRDPKLIDLQNCFCETDKYLRVKLPSLEADNKRIKQRFTKPKEFYKLTFPPKWELSFNKK